MKELDRSKWHKGETIPDCWFRFEGDITTCVEFFTDHYTWSAYDGYGRTLAGWSASLKQAMKKADQAANRMLMEREQEADNAKGS